jgi:hypothetical protein
MLQESHSIGSRIQNKTMCTTTTRIIDIDLLLDYINIIIYYIYIIDSISLQYIVEHLCTTRRVTESVLSDQATSVMRQHRH